MCKVDRHGKCIARTSKEEVQRRKEARIPVNNQWWEDMKRITERRKVCSAS